MCLQIGDFAGLVKERHSTKLLSRHIRNAATPHSGREGAVEWLLEGVLLGCHRDPAHRKSLEELKAHLSLHAKNVDSMLVPEQTIQRIPSDNSGSGSAAEAKGDGQPIRLVLARQNTE